MAYQSLYRRYRSQKFAEVLGQPHVTGALQAAVAEGRHGHAYLFSGPRGTGKTSTARVLAKALNCENLTDGEPCSTCESCLAIEGGKSFDLHELDAASHNKVDDIRDLISKVQLGSPGRTKVYILDEVHMLSSGAENALLKTLEEPPDHVVFVLATTEPQKVVPTIRSRTQHFEFHLLPADVLGEHVRSVITDAELDVDDDAIDYVLRQGGGSARDTLSALDLVAAAGGVPAGTDIAEALAEAIGERDSAKAIGTIQQGLELGREPRTIGEDTLDLLRNAFLASMDAPLSHLNDQARTTSEALAAALGPATLTRSLEAIGQTLVEMRQAPDPRVPLEVTLLRLTRAPAASSDDSGGLQERIDALEARLAAIEAGGAPIGRANQAPAPAQAAPTASAAPAPAPAADAAAPASGGGDRGSRPPRSPRSPRGEGQPSRPPRREQPAPQQAPAAAEAPTEQAPQTPPVTQAPAEAPAPAAAEAAPVEQAPTPPPAAPAASGEPLALDAVSSALSLRLEDLSQKVRARFKGGRLLAVDGSTVRFGVPNQIHRDRCDDVKSDVETALSEHFGQAVVIDVVIDEAPQAPIDPAKLEPKPKPAPVDSAAEEAEIGPVTELADAEDQSSRGVDRITKAFPGSKVIDAPAE